MDHKQTTWLEEANPVRKCPRCHKTKPCIEFYDKGLKERRHPECIDCQRSTARERVGRGGRGKGKQGNISTSEARDMLERQLHRCLMCDTKITYENGKVDHDHTTGIVRAWVCARCNIVLGVMESGMIEKGTAYLERFK